MKQKPLYSITTIAELLNVHPRTLRIYDKMGILKPFRTDKNRRMYCCDDYQKALLITYLTRNLALNLSGVKILLGLSDKLKIKPKKFISAIKEVACEFSINEIQNIEKTSKKGRKPKTPIVTS